MSGSFFISLSEGCPLLETIEVVQFLLGDDRRYYYDEHDGYFPPLDRSAYTNVDFRPCFERCPKLKHVILPLCSDEQIKALVQHCPLVEEVRYQPSFLVHLSHTHPLVHTLEHTP